MRRFVWFFCLILAVLALAEIPSSTSGQQLRTGFVAGDYSKLPLAFEANRGQADPRVLFLAHGAGYSLFLTSSGEVIRLKEPGFRGDRGDIGADRPARRPGSDVVAIRFEGMNSAARVSALDELPGKTNYFIGNDPAQWRAGIPNYGRIQYDTVYPGIRVVDYGTERHLEQDFVVFPGADSERIALRLEGAERISVGPEGDLRLDLAGGELRLRKPAVYQVSNPRQGKVDRIPVEGRFVVQGRNLVRFHLGPYDRTKTLIIDPVLDYSTYFGGSANDLGNAVAVDSGGEAYVMGTTASADFPSTSGAYQTACKPSSSSSSCSGDAFVTKLSADGTTELFSTYLGGSGSESGLGIALDASGNAYVTGQTSSSDFPLTTFAFQSTFAPGCTVSPNCVNAFVSKISADGSQLLYSTYLGGNNVDSGNAIAVDASGNAYLVGQTASTNFPVTASTALQSKCGSDGICNASGGVAMPDAFMAEINPSASSGPGSLLYSTYLGGSGVDFGVGLALDSASPPNVYLTGSTQSTDFPVTASTAFQAACKLDASGICEAEPFVVKLSPASGSAPTFTLAYGTHLGGSEGGTGLKFTDGGNAIAVDSAGDASITGETASTDFPVSSRAFQPKCGTDGNCNPVSGVRTADAFVAKLDPAASGPASLLYSTYLGGNGFDVGTAIAVGPDNVVYVTGGTDSTDFSTANPLQAASAGERDVFVTVLDSMGSGEVFSSYLGGSANDQGQGIAVNSSGDAYVTGSTLSTNFPTSTSAFQSTNHGNQDAFVTLIGGTTAPFVFLSSTSPVSLGSVDVGSSGSPMALTVSNTGDDSLTISKVTIAGTNPGDFRETDDCANATVAPEGSCTVNITFTPAAAGARSGTLSFADSALNSPQVVTLNGTGLAPVVSLSASTLTFPSQVLGTTSGGQNLTVTNTGTAALAVSGITITGTDSGDFSETSTSCSSVAVGASCTITVTFKPAAAGSRIATLTLTDNDNAASGSMQTVALTGTGSAPAISVTPASLSFPSQTLHTTSSAKSITLQNTSTVTISITSVSITGAEMGDFHETNTCGSSLSAGASCTISVTFTPTASGARSASVSIADSAANSPQTASLSGQGADFSLSVSPTTNTVTAGQAATYALTVAPQGGFNQQVSLTCSQPPNLTLTNCTFSAASVTPADGTTPVQVTVTVMTTAPSATFSRRTFPRLPPSSRPFLWPAALVAGMLVLRLRRRYRPAPVLALTVLLVLLWASCGGGGSSSGSGSTPGTTPGNYALSLNATSTGLTHSLTINLDVH